MYISTRGNFNKVQAAEAIRLGMVPTGGLFVPEQIPVLSQEDIYGMAGLNYREIAQKIIEPYMRDYSAVEIDQCISNAYNEANFGQSIAPLYKLKDGTYLLELWHGPTAAFKDIALQIMPYFLSLALKKVKTDNETVILVATSGDTGKAALEGFKNVPGIKIIVFYPYKGVSKIQEFQMSTTDGNNTFVVAVKGNFDDCQNAVKDIFGDEEYNHRLNLQGIELSSANSINWGRLLPQIVYYFSAYLDVIKRGDIKPGDNINFVVPTGNFGNILAGYYAKQMGLPINKLICASNENKVLTDFFATGVYNRNRNFFTTNSPSMDILISSNLERFLFELTNHDSDRINKWFTDLRVKGSFEIDRQTKELLGGIIWAGFASEENTLALIKEVFESDAYALDTHTAVGVKVYREYVNKTGDNTCTVVASTANPYKFNSAVLQAIKGESVLDGKDEFHILEELNLLTGMEIHPGLKDLDKKTVFHERVCEKNEVRVIVKDILQL